MNQLEYETFAEAVGTTFNVAQTVEIRLAEISLKREIGRQVMFALYFVGPKEPFIPQGTYEMSHPTLGNGELFLVPVAETSDGFKYEAAFNRISEA